MPKGRDESDRQYDEPVYMIGVAARLCGLHPQTLRLYERLGLIRPSRKGAQKRLYSQADIERLRRIQHLTQDLGVNLAGAEIILRLLNRIEQMNREMEELIQLTNARSRHLIDQFDLPVEWSNLEIRIERDLGQDEQESTP